MYCLSGERGSFDNTKLKAGQILRVSFGEIAHFDQRSGFFNHFEVAFFIKFGGMAVIVVCLEVDSFDGQRF